MHLQKGMTSTNPKAIARDWQLYHGSGECLLIYRAMWWGQKRRFIVVHDPETNTSVICLDDHLYLYDKIHTCVCPIKSLSYLINTLDIGMSWKATIKYLHERLG